MKNDNEREFKLTRREYLKATKCPFCKNTTFKVSLVFEGNDIFCYEMVGECLKCGRTISLYSG